MMRASASIGAPESDSGIRYVDAAQITQLLRFDDLIPHLRAAFAGSHQLPSRHHHHVDHDGGRNTLLLMPAWNDRYLGLKVVIVAPANVQLALPSLSSTYNLFDKASGRALVQLDGNAITSRRTVAASALAASFLARRDSTRMLIAGTGRVASLLPAAYRAVLPIEQVAIYSRSSTRSAALAERLRTEGFDATVCDELQTGVASADVISCATQAKDIIVQGEWLRPGQFVDLIGSFEPHTREADDLTIQRSKIVIDTDAALGEAGDLLIPASRGLWSTSRLDAKLGDLCKGDHPGRTRSQELWLFKSVGTALEDLVAAQLVYECLPRAWRSRS